MPSVTERRAPRIGAVVLAAGRSRRFGFANKLLAPLRGEALLWRTLDAILASRVRPIVIVTGHQRGRLCRSLLAYRRARGALPRMRCVHNARWRSGMAGSLQAGLAALPADLDGALICLGDMPDLRSTLLDRLRRAYRHGDDAVLPMIDTQRGNPVLLGRPLFAAVRERLRGDEGARRLIAQAPRVRAIAASRDALHDIDTRRDLAHCSRHRPRR